MVEIAYDNKCTPYCDDDGENPWIPCKCPVCGGFLPGNIFQDPLICKKCGSELIAIEHSEDFKESDDYDLNEGEGKICVVTKRTKTKRQTKEEREINRLVKEGAKKWKPWL